MRTICRLLEWKPPFAAGVPLWTSCMKGVSFSSAHCLMSVCLISLSLKCFTVSIYENRPLNVHRDDCTLTRKAESWPLRRPAVFPKAFLLFLCNSLQEEKSRPPDNWLITGVGCEAGGPERGRAVKCCSNSWLKRGNGRYNTSSIDTHWVGARLNRSVED